MIEEIKANIRKINAKNINANLNAKKSRIAATKTLPINENTSNAVL